MKLPPFLKKLPPAQRALVLAGVPAVGVAAVVSRRSSSSSSSSSDGADGDDGQDGGVSIVDGAIPGGPAVSVPAAPPVDGGYDAGVSGELDAVWAAVDGVASYTDTVAGDLGSMVDTVAADVAAVSARTSGDALMREQVRAIYRAAGAPVPDNLEALVRRALTEPGYLATIQRHAARDAGNTTTTAPRSSTPSAPSQRDRMREQVRAIYAAAGARTPSNLERLVTRALNEPGYLATIRKHAARDARGA